MKKNKETIIKTDKDVAQYYSHFFANTVREPFIILDHELRVVGANDSFYRTFQTTKEQTEKNSFMI